MKPSLAKTVARYALAAPIGQWALNRAYDVISLKAKHRFYRSTAKMYREPGAPSLAEGLWRVRFSGASVLIPLVSAEAWLYWDIAASVLGHDPEIKGLYLERIKAREVDTFIDIGGNYGTHSLMFLRAGVRVLTFEPNPTCVSVFEQLCALNRVTPTLHAAALGTEPATAMLSFPERETWNGKIGDGDPGDKTMPVNVLTLNDFTHDAAGRVLVKIDVEGYELQVLRGGDEFIRDHRPDIIFESNQGDPTRQELHPYLSELGYQIRGLGAHRALGVDAFTDTSTRNFLAVPAHAGI